MAVPPELVLYGLLAAIVYLIFYFEGELPATLCLSLTVSSVVLGAGLAAAATYVLPISFIESTMGFGGVMLLVTSIYTVTDKA